MKPPETHVWSDTLLTVLIVLQILAGLVGIAVPYFQSGLSVAQPTLARQDLEVLKKALVLHRTHEGDILAGQDLAPLVGRYLQELPSDPWGNPYLYDSEFGVVATLGADALPGGSGGDTDVLLMLNDQKECRSDDLLRIAEQLSDRSQDSAAKIPVLVLSERGCTGWLGSTCEYSSSIESTGARNRRSNR